MLEKQMKTKWLVLRKITFNGSFVIEADSKEEAIEYVKDYGLNQSQTEEINAWPNPSDDDLKKLGII
jgi:hypothetical protein